MTKRKNEFVMMAEFVMMGSSAGFVALEAGERRRVNDCAGELENERFRKNVDCAFGDDVHRKLVCS